MGSSYKLTPGPSISHALPHATSTGSRDGHCIPVIAGSAEYFQFAPSIWRDPTAGVCALGEHRTAAFYLGGRPCHNLSGAVRSAPADLRSAPTSTGQKENGKGKGMAKRVRNCKMGRVMLFNRLA